MLVLQLVVLLAIFDSLFLLHHSLQFCVEDVLERYFEFWPLWYTKMYPYVVYPLKDFLIFSTIYMIVAVSIERYHAFTSPLTHHPQSWPYICLVIVSAGIVNYIFLVQPII